MWELSQAVPAKVAVMGATIFGATLAAPFLFAGFGLDWGWMAPVLFQVGWCLAEGVNTGWHRPAAIPKQLAALQLPILTGVVALCVTFASLSECFLTLREGGGLGEGSSLMMGLGFLIGGLGIPLRQLAIRTLGNRFRDEVSLGEDHEIETGGIYRWLVHPGELGFGLAMLGTVFLCRSLVGFSLFLVALLPLMLIRVRRENQLIRRATAHSTIILE